MEEKNMNYKDGVFKTGQSTLEIIQFLPLCPFFFLDLVVLWPNWEVGSAEVGLERWILVAYLCGRGWGVVVENALLLLSQREEEEVEEEHQGRRPPHRA